MRTDGSISVGYSVSRGGVSLRGSVVQQSYSWREFKDQCVSLAWAETLKDLCSWADSPSFPAKVSSFKLCCGEYCYVGYYDRTDQSDSSYESNLRIHKKSQGHYNIEITYVIAFVTNSVTPFAEGLCHRAKTSASSLTHNTKESISGTQSGVSLVRCCESGQTLVQSIRGTKWRWSSLRDRTTLIGTRRNAWVYCCGAQPCVLKVILCSYN